LPGLPRAKLLVAARWLVTVLARWLVLHSVDLDSVPGLIGRAAPSGLGLAGLVVEVQFLVLVWRWQLVIRILGSEAVGVGPLALLVGRSFVRRLSPICEPSTVWS
jgi:hypothetical protein